VHPHPASTRCGGEIPRRWAASKIPQSERSRPKWLVAFKMIDELAGWDLYPPLLTADAGYGQVAEFRQGLTDRGISYIVVTTSSTTPRPARLPTPEWGNIPRRDIRIRLAVSKTSPSTTAPSRPHLGLVG
jgi:hypothetical protein